MDLKIIPNISETKNWFLENVNKEEGSKMATGRELQTL
jgi:hypothetical protein